MNKLENSIHDNANGLDYTADGQTAMREPHAPTRPGWRDSHFYALYSHKIPGR